MPKNTGKGGKQRKRGKNANDQSKRDIITADEGEAYAVVIAPMGNYQMSIRLDNMTTATGIVRGALRKKVWIVSGDLIRVQLRTGFEEGTVDIVGKYTHNEAQDLVKAGAVPQALLTGPGGAGAAGAGKSSIAQNITFVNQQATVAESSKDKQSQEKSRTHNIDLVAIMKNPNRAGVGIGDSDDEDGPEENPMRGWKANKRQIDDDDDDDDEEDEEDEEGEEGEEGEEEEEEDEAMDADAYYDSGRAENQADWNKHHNHKKDQDYKQRNKRAKENQQAGAKGVTAEDVSDI